jgi:hypothetical protein
MHASREEDIKTGDRSVGSDIQTEPILLQTHSRVPLQGLMGPGPDDFLFVRVFFCSQMLICLQVGEK